MLYIIATPIGNLEDISQRAIDTLKSVDLIVAEDTRHSRKLLSHFNISKPLESFHKDSPDSKIAKIINQLKLGKQIALVTDAGTPAISDPGFRLVSAAYKEAKLKAKLSSKKPSSLQVIPIPGPSAVTAGLSVSGFPAQQFTFFGYPPKRKKRNKFFKELINCPRTCVFFSTKWSIKKDLQILADLGINKRQIFIAREMTKKFETFYRGNINQILQEIESSTIKGEYTIVLDKK